MKDLIKKELNRLWPFLLLILLLLAPDPGALSVVGYAVGIVAVALVMAHVSRKVLFPYLDLGSLIKEIGTENNIAASIVVLSMVVLMGIILNGIVALLK